MQKTEIDAVVDLIKTGVWPEELLSASEFQIINDAVNDVRAQVRQEQRENDAQIARKLCGAIVKEGTHDSWCGCEIAAAILAQDD